MIERLLLELSLMQKLSQYNQRLPSLLSQRDKRALVTRTFSKAVKIAKENDEILGKEENCS